MMPTDPAAAAAMTDAAATVERLRDVIAVLSASVQSCDLLTARYAAVSLSELSNKVETLLLTADRHARALARPPLSVGDWQTLVTDLGDAQLTRPARP